ncbi:Cyclic nucleotide-binding protein [Pseudocohnilembus persalinus]|uniref:Cyclic nucleotide-binding protein n=1 Tax=Pseudocohnilembus persalinus TaxID=266149 RepID=A0A0V0R6F3_PSEPJ|nr:Cyclic nucleotide-binding protein [Pseudocohnilembus persalinus]|eukprot:KRX09736.1 Cyclic nucleotide-binding protein [Pseudocohnilembus persalinus]
MNVFKELEHLELQEQRGNIKGLGILQQVSKGLQDAVFYEYYGRILKNSQFQKISQYSFEFIKALTIKMQEINLGQEVILLEQGKIDSRYLFLIEGSVQVYQNKNQKQSGIYQSIQNQNLLKEKYIQIQQISKKFSEFNSKQFYINSEAEFSVKCLSHSRFVYFKRKDFLEVLKSFPKDMNAGLIRFGALCDKVYYREQLMHIRADIIQNYMNEIIFYDIDDSDKSFLLKIPQIIFNKDGSLDIDDIEISDDSVGDSENCQNNLQNILVQNDCENENNQIQNYRTNSQILQKNNSNYQNSSNNQKKMMCSTQEKMGIERESHLNSSQKNNNNQESEWENSRVNFLN